ncbi:hypothetical protein ACZ90_26740 [Streptomyces albus subsp. albus]|nr:hypothetical protein ACZ90_26740 [Streptomyces albus subsp. albus]
MVQNLLPAPCPFRISSHPSQVLLDLLVDVFADPFQVGLPPVVSSSELVALQRDTAAFVFDVTHVPHRSPLDATRGAEDRFCSCER